MIAGVDGCRAGWVVAMADGWPCPRLPKLRTCADFAAVLRATEACDFVVVDIPIGLLAEGAGRECDRLAKQMLGPAAASRVFWPPPRRALAATSPQEFQTLHVRLAGVGAGYPVWGIVPKLLDVDRSMTPRIQQRVREFHPELVWRRLAGKVLSSKHKPAGMAERWSILNAHIGELPSPAEWRALVPRGAQLDDAFDALVGLAAAQAISDGREPPYRLPDSDVPIDSTGLRMEVWY